MPALHKSYDTFECRCDSPPFSNLSIKSHLLFRLFRCPGGAMFASISRCAASRISACLSPIDLSRRRELLNQVQGIVIRSAAIACVACVHQQPRFIVVVLGELGTCIRACSFPPLSIARRLRSPARTAFAPPKLSPFFRLQNGEVVVSPRQVLRRAGRRLLRIFANASCHRVQRLQLPHRCAKIRRRTLAVALVVLQNAAIVVGPRQLLRVLRILGRPS